MIQRTHHPAASGDRRRRSKSILVPLAGENAQDMSTPSLDCAGVLIFHRWAHERLQNVLAGANHRGARMDRYANFTARHGLVGFTACRGPQSVVH